MNIEEVANIAESYREDFCKASKSLRRARKLLSEIYGMYGPRNSGVLIKPRAFAKMTGQQVDQTYDSSARHKMHAVAKFLSE